MHDNARIYIVATPIGNLEDLSPRAQRILREVDIIAAEDTRHTAKLLHHFGIKDKELVSYHDHIEEQRAQELVDRIKADNLHLAVVSDAGTPCIADPGYRIVAKAKEAKVEVSPIPGPSALTALASAAGLPTDRILFIGFLPTKQQSLLTEVRSWQQSRASIICYESARRLRKTMAVLAAELPQARVAIAREITKLYEEIVLLSPVEAVDWLAVHANLKGEVTMMVAPGTKEIDTEAVIASISSQARIAFAQGATHKDLLLRFADQGLERKALYQLLLSLIKG